MYQYIFFDLDGTITDSAKGIMNSVAYAFERFGVEEPDREKLKRFIGPPLIYSFQEFYGFSETDAEKAVEVYREYYAETGIFENDIYEDVEEVFMGLKKSGKKLVLATSKPEVYAIRILKHFGLYEYFDFIGGATLDESRNDKVAVLSYILESLKIENRSEIIMIGDRHHDIEGANVHGLDSLGVLYGYGSREELEEAGATYLTETVKGILEIVE